MNYHVTEENKQIYLQMISGYIGALVQWQQSIQDTPVTCDYLYDYLRCGPSGFAGSWWIQDRTNALSRT